MKVNTVKRGQAGHATSHNAKTNNKSQQRKPWAANPNINPNATRDPVSNTAFINAEDAGDTAYSLPTAETGRAAGGGERVKVAVRCRPLLHHELQRSDESVVQCVDAANLVLKLPGGQNK